MLLGRVVFAAPLSLFAPLSTVQTMNDLQVQRLLANRCKYGRVYRCVISITKLNVVYYSMLARGLKAKNPWHVSTATWPIFAANHAALAMKHFRGGLIDGGLTLNTAREYARSHARLTNVLLMPVPHDSLAASNHTDLTNLAKYLNLTVPRQTVPRLKSEIYLDIFAPNGPTDHHLLLRNYALDRTCYVCHDDCICFPSQLFRLSVAPVTTRRYRFDFEGDDDDMDPQRVPSYAEAVARDASSDNVTDGNVADSTNRARASCGLSNILQDCDGAFTTDEIRALANQNFINLLALYPNSAHHDELLRYQVYGLAAFPHRALDRNVHIH
ncbi:hypothetical protein EAI_08553 [Harpegnathos saltator]|uniref:Uncharacterized protein n=1 Tax=Harpegnathos saltator TaxID=610380 RepID=E2C4X7_HARSA|nr:hypothetical protein EAI_08553 [Harpegnathos saltator]